MKIIATPRRWRWRWPLHRPPATTVTVELTVPEVILLTRAVGISSPDRIGPIPGGRPDDLYGDLCTLVQRAGLEAP